MSSLAPVVRRGRKFNQVIEGARSVFLRDGFSAASMDDIAREAGVSKATLYSYFPDKRGLFMEMASAECLRMAETAEAEVASAGPLRDVLLEAARRIVVLVTSDVSLRIFRICVAEADRFPELGRAFYEAGPMLGRMRIAAHFREACAQGQLKIDDIDLAAEQFAALCKAINFDRVVFGAGDKPTPEDCERVARGAVETFLARYGT